MAQVGTEGAFPLFHLPPASNAAVVRQSFMSAIVVVRCPAFCYELRVPGSVGKLDFPRAWRGEQRRKQRTLFS